MGSVDDHSHATTCHSGYIGLKMNVYLSSTGARILLLIILSLAHIQIARVVAQDPGTTDPALSDPTVQRAMQLLDSTRTVLKEKKIKVKKHGRVVKIKGTVGPIVLTHRMKVFRGGLVKEMVRIRSADQGPFSHRMRLVKWNGRVVFVRLTDRSARSFQVTQRAFDVEGMGLY